MYALWAVGKEMIIEATECNFHTNQLLLGHSMERSDCSWNCKYKLGLIGFPYFCMEWSIAIHCWECDHITKTPTINQSFYKIVQIFFYWTRKSWIEIKSPNHILCNIDSVQNNSSVLTSSKSQNISLSNLMHSRPCLLTSISL